jgi:hypothetical protein
LISATFGIDDPDPVGQALEYRAMMTYQRFGHATGGGEVRQSTPPGHEIAAAEM